MTGEAMFLFVVMLVLVIGFVILMTFAHADELKRVDGFHRRELEAHRAADAEWSHLLRHAVEDGMNHASAMQTEWAAEREQWARLAVSAGDAVNYGALNRSGRITSADLGEAEIHRAQANATRIQPRPATQSPLLYDQEGEAIIPVGFG